MCKILRDTGAQLRLTAVTTVSNGTARRTEANAWSRGLRTALNENLRSAWLFRRGLVLDSFACKSVGHLAVEQGRRDAGPCPRHLRTGGIGLVIVIGHACGLARIGGFAKSAML